MKHELSGLRDKLYWRRIGPGPVQHCFKKLSEDAAQLLGYGRQAVFGSLCERHIITRSGGQAVERPIPSLRCGLCDGREMDRRGWDESGPTTIEGES